ncbi:hypothetical protein NDU88_002939 [Pleurodeles waltl]|uniref:Uncharacterized protein n=1 Tax=Pleurodeles waltl TaxID=8319 RepID=A0AAV7V0K2_PLEWA|nr:hypothetical protein NDU88_002939 [Pleurodeles waltl]
MRPEKRRSPGGRCSRGCRLLDGGRARPPCWWCDWRSGLRSRAKPRPRVILRPDARWMVQGERLRMPRGGARAADCDSPEHYWTSSRLRSPSLCACIQRVHTLGPKRRDETNRPCPIIACLLRHVQTRQLLQAARSDSTFLMDGLEMRLTADFPKETSEPRRVFLALRPRLRQLEVKYGLFKPAGM